MKIALAFIIFCIVIGGIVGFALAVNKRETEKWETFDNWDEEHIEEIGRWR